MFYPKLQQNSCIIHLILKITRLFWLALKVFKTKDKIVEASNKVDKIVVYLSKS